MCVYERERETGRKKDGGGGQREEERGRRETAVKLDARMKYTINPLPSSPGNQYLPRVLLPKAFDIINYYTICICVARSQLEVSGTRAQRAPSFE